MEDRIAKIVEDIVASENIYLVDFEVKGSKSRPKIFIYIDTMDGVTIDQCEKVNRMVQAELDALEDFPMEYSLDVSSPGIDKPLKFLWQYKKNIGRNVRVSFNDSNGQTRTEEGQLLMVKDNSILVQFNKGNMEIPFDSILKTKVLITW
ncbi:MAG: ribosome maturation factor RimP [Calditrichia bacterium]